MHYTCSCLTLLYVNCSAGKGRRDLVFFFGFPFSFFSFLCRNNNNTDDDASHGKDGIGIARISHIMIFFYLLNSIR